MRDARDGEQKPRALFFLHGFNVSFEEVAIRAAQMRWGKVFMQGTRLLPSFILRYPFALRADTREPACSA
jgi:hypothetical protein